MLDSNFQIRHTCGTLKKSKLSDMQGSFTNVLWQPGKWPWSSFDP